VDDATITSALQDGLFDAVRRVSPRVEPPVAVVSLEIYPWHSYVALSVLDASSSPGIENSPADWPLFECASSFDAGRGAEVIGAWGPVAEAMNERWSSAVASSAGVEVTDHLHRLAAQALRSAAISEALEGAGWEGCLRQVINADDPAQRNFATDESRP
jgi:hypothetical protein